MTKQTTRLRKRHWKIMPGRIRCSSKKEQRFGTRKVMEPRSEMQTNGAVPKLGKKKKKKGNFLAPNICSALRKIKVRVFSIPKKK